MSRRVGQGLEACPLPPTAAPAIPARRLWGLQPARALHSGRPATQRMPTKLEQHTAVHAWHLLAP